jgi:type II secretion system protein N
MHFLKSKILWLVLYAVVITGVFLYFLFPSELALRQMEAASSASAFILKADTLRPSLPLGVKLKDVIVRAAQPSADVMFQSEALDLQVNPLSFFRKNKSMYFSGTAYGGRFDGSAGFASLANSALPVEGNVSFKDMDLARYSLQGLPIVRGMSGKVKGTLDYSALEGGPNASGKISLYLTRGAYPLPEPFLGVSRIEFDRGEIQAQLKNAIVKLSKFEFYGTQVNCFLTGDIQLGSRMDDSRLNLKGVLEIVGKNKIKMNVTVGGTLASPSFRYI